MCDCYDHKCEICDHLVPMHISDFDYERSEFKVWCKNHILKAPLKAIVFTLTGRGRNEFRKGWQCAILGPKVGTRQGNCPNIGADWDEEVITKKGRKMKWRKRWQ